MLFEPCCSPSTDWKKNFIVHLCWQYRRIPSLRLVFKAFWTFSFAVDRLKKKLYCPRCFETFRATWARASDGCSGTLTWRIGFTASSPRRSRERRPGTRSRSRLSNPSSLSLREEVSYADCKPSILRSSCRGLAPRLPCTGEWHHRVTSLRAHRDMVVFPAAVEEAVNQKDDPLLSLLRSVYVDSTDPTPAEVRRGHQDMLGSFLLSHTTDTKQLPSIIHTESSFSIYLLLVAKSLMFSQGCSELQVLWFVLCKISNIIDIIS